MPGVPKASIEITGFDHAAAFLLRLSDFRRLARIPLNAALGAVKDVMVAEVGSRKAARAMKVRVFNDPDGLVGYAGPVGGAQRPGYLAALFNELGTGIYGPRHQPIRPKHKQAFAFFDQSAVTAHFGPSAQVFTKSGRLRRAAYGRFGNAGQTVLRQTRGAPARPWFARSITRGREVAPQRFAEKWHEQVVGAQGVASR